MSEEVNQELLEAVRMGKADTVQRLIKEKKADPNASIYKELSREGSYSLLHFAVEKGFTEVLQVLLAAGAKQEVLLGTTPLHLAAAYGHLAIMQALLVAKASVNTEDSRQRSALHIAAKQGHSDAVAMLISAKANINVLDENKNTPLRQAAFSGSLAAVSALLAAKADVAAGNERRSTPLMAAIEQNHLAIAQILLEAKSESATPLNIGQNEALHIAACQYNLEAVNLLVKMRAKPLKYTLYEAVADDRTRGGKSAAIVKSLLEAGFNPESYSIRAGCRVLDMAAGQGNLPVVQLLLEAGADPKRRDFRNGPGETARDFAIRGGHSAVAEFLQQAVNESDRVFSIIKQSLQSLPLPNEMVFRKYTKEGSKLYYLIYNDKAQAEKAATAALNKIKSLLTGVTSVVVKQNEWDGFVDQDSCYFSLTEAQFMALITQLAPASSTASARLTTSFDAKSSQLPSATAVLAPKKDKKASGGIAGLFNRPQQDRSRSPAKPVPESVTFASELYEAMKSCALPLPDKIVRNSHRTDGTELYRIVYLVGRDEYQAADTALSKVKALLKDQSDDIYKARIIYSQGDTFASKGQWFFSLTPMQGQQLCKLAGFSVLQQPQPVAPASAAPASPAAGLAPAAGR